MVNNLESALLPRKLRHEKGLWNYRDRYPTAMGCSICPFRDVCGGLQTKRPLFDCLHLCCGKPENCDVVCLNNPKNFAPPIREVSGFSFDNVPRAQELVSPNLPAVVPAIFHNDNRCNVFNGSPTVCLPLFSVVPRADGHERFMDPHNLAKHFGIAVGTSVILSGTAKDAPLERWWSLGPRRRDAIKAMLDLRISMVTSPNYSLFTDQPRTDDLHSMKRIALAHEEFLSEGLPAALHVNLRTEKDMERWAEFIIARPEVTHVAYEFGTGAG